MLIQGCFKWKSLRIEVLPLKVSLVLELVLCCVKYPSYPKLSVSARTRQIVSQSKIRLQIIRNILEDKISEKEDD